MGPIVVMQADARRLPGAVRAPLSVGLVRWRGLGANAVSVVAKATMTFAENGPEVVARLCEPHPVGHARPSEIDPAVLREPTDFVIGKAMCDLMLVGHAHTSEPSQSIACALGCDGFRLQFRAQSATKSLSVPLLASHLVTESGESLVLAPLAVEREGDDDLFDALDPARFQVAPAPSRLASLRANSRLELEGLSPRAPRRVVTLPGLAPRVFLEPRMEAFEEVALRCDTLVVDTDFETLTLSWRGIFFVADPSLDRMIVSLEEVESPRDLQAILGDLPRGEVGFAVEDEPLDLDLDELELARHEVLLHAARPSLSLDEYAGLVARLAEGRRPREDELALHGLDERSWTIEDRAWSEAMMRGVDRGDGTLAADYAESFARAQRALAGPNEPRSSEEYTEIKSRLAAGGRPDEVLREHGISLGEWMRLERHHAVGSSS